MATRRCWNCDNVAHMTPHGVAVRLNDETDRQIAIVQAGFRCDECGWLQIGQATRSLPVPGSQARFAPEDSWAWNVENWLEREAELQWLPAVGVSPTFADVPPHIADAAQEAHRCYSIGAYRGATALARAVVEGSAKAKEITKGQLYDKIEELQEAGHVRPHIRDAAHEIRHLGNDVAHGDFVEPILREEAEETLELMSEVLQEVFQSPARIERAKARRVARKQRDASE